MSGYESPRPEEEITGEGAAEMNGGDGAMGAGGAEAPDMDSGGGGDATGGGSMGDQDAMGADDERTVEEGAGGPVSGFAPDDGESGLNVPPETPVP